MKGIWVLVLGLMLSGGGCTAFYQPAPSTLDGAYYEQIRDWQDRVRQEGWTRNLLDDVVKGCLRLAKYRLEKDDHWDTPREFMEKGFQGDCEDIAVFILATLKRLGYEKPVRVMAVKTLMGDHALVKVALPRGDWKTYETVPVPLGEVDRLFYRPIVEFDEERILYYEKKRSS